MRKRSWKLRNVHVGGTKGDLAQVTIGDTEWRQVFRLMAEIHDGPEDGRHINTTLDLSTMLGELGRDFGTIRYTVWFYEPVGGHFQTYDTELEMVKAISRSKNQYANKGFHREPTYEVTRIITFTEPLPEP